MTFAPERITTVACLLLLGSVLLPDPAAAATAYKETTGDLDLSRVRLVVVAPSDMAASLQRRATLLFQEAGLSLAGSGSADAALATLTLTLAPQPVETCPGTVLYAPSLTLTEPVVIPRTGQVYSDATWIVRSERAVTVASAIDSVRMEKELDGFVSQFLADYRAANIRRPPHMRAVSEAPTRHERTVRPVLHVSVLAGPASPALKMQAEQQLARTGFRTSPTSRAEEVIDLSIELVQQPLGAECPGQVLYERGIYLVEPVQVARRPHVTLWSDTWHEDSVRIVPALSASELAADQRTLLEEFIRTHSHWMAP